MRSRPILITLLGSIGLASGACNDTDAENAHASDQQAEAWVAADEPLLTIGANHEDPAQQFSGIVGAYILANDRIVIADSASRTLRFFDRTGVLTRESGGRGEGPGEFRNIWRIWPLDGDNVLVYDWWLRRYSLFDGQGTFLGARAASATPDGLVAAPIAPLSNRTVLVSHWRVPRESEYPEGSVFRDTLAYYTLDISGPWSPAKAPQAGPIQHVADLPGSTRFGDRTGRVWAPRPVPFAPVGVIAVAQNRLYFSPADSFTIDVLDPDGTHHATWRIPGQFEEVTAADIQESLDAQLATPARDERNQPLASDPLSGFYRRLYDAMPFPDRKAAVARILIDDLGNVWIEHYREFNTRQRPSLWSVVDPTGRLLTQIETPSNVRLTQVTAAELIGIRLNENDVESVVVYELAKRSK